MSNGICAFQLSITELHITATGYSPPPPCSSFPPPYLFWFVCLTNAKLNKLNSVLANSMKARQAHQRDRDRDRVREGGELYTLHLCQLFCYGCLHHRTKIIYLFPSQSDAHTQKGKREEGKERGCGGSIETDADLQYTSTHCVITRDRVSKRETERYAHCSIRNKD